MSILVTGSTGFIGSHLVDTLIARGERVKTLVRKTSNVDYLKDEEAELVVGDLRDPESLVKAMKGSDIVYHLAAAVDWKPKKVLWEVNVVGTENMLRAALSRGVQRFVYCSSVGVFGFSNSLMNEESPYNPSPHSFYSHTKVEGEKLAKAYYGRGLPVTIVRPAAVYGPRCIYGMPRLWRWIQRGVFFFIEGGESLVHPVYVSDVVDGLILAGENPRAIGESYNIAGEESVTWKKWASTVAKALGKDSPKRSIPLWFAHVISFFSGIKSLTHSSEPFYAPYWVECTSKSFAFDISKARRELGFKPKVRLEEGCRMTTQWYREKGYLK